MKKPRNIDQLIDNFISDESINQLDQNYRIFWSRLLEFVVRTKVQVADIQKESSIWEGAAFWQFTTCQAWNDWGYYRNLGFPSTRAEFRKDLEKIVAQCSALDWKRVQSIGSDGITKFKFKRLVAASAINFGFRDLEQLLSAFIKYCLYFELGQLSALTGQGELKRHIQATYPQFNDVISLAKKRKIYQEFIGCPDSSNQILTQHESYRMKLSIPPILKDNISYFGTKAIELEERSEEKKRLENFLSSNEEHMLSWLQLAGVAGQGKSRMALSLVLDAKSRREFWNAGFFEWQFNNGLDWNIWTPEAPHLIVIDYVASRTQEVAQVFEVLLNRSDLFEWPVKILLLERQCWYMPSQHSTKSQQKALNNYSSIFSTKASWYSDIVNRFDKSIYAKFINARYSSGVLILDALEESQLFQIVKKVYFKISGKRLLLQEEKVIEQLKRFDNKGRPLYAYFLGQVLAFEKELGAISKNNLLTEILKRECKSWWVTEFSNDPLPRLGDDTLISRLTNFATMLNGISWDTALNKGCITSRPSYKEIRQAIILVGGDLEEDDFLSPSPSQIPPLQPDLLGEWYVLSSFSGGLPINEVVKLAKDYSEERLITFVQRICEDFEENITTLRVLESIDYLSLSDIQLSRVFSIAYNFNRIPLTSMIEAVESRIALGQKTVDLDKALLVLGCTYYLGRRTKENRPKAMSLFKKVADGFSDSKVEAMFNLGMSYSRDSSDEYNPKSAFYWFEKAANEGDAVSQFSLGLCYANGFGVSKNMKIALDWYHRAAKNGDVDALYCLGLHYGKRFSIDHNPTKSFLFLHKAAHAELPAAMFSLGTCYAEGYGIKQDNSAAIQWITRSAKLGDVDAMYSLGLCYAKNFLVEKDFPKAIHWFERAADLDNVNAMYSLGVCLLRGYDCDVDFDKAFASFRRASELGHSGGSYYLSVCYKFGYGVEKSLPKADKFKILAEEQGHDVNRFDAADELTYFCSAGPNTKNIPTWHLRYST